jgi:hypothetical protein
MLIYLIPQFVIAYQQFIQPLVGTTTLYLFLWRNNLLNKNLINRMKKIFLLGTGIVVSMIGFAQLSVGLQGIGNLADAKIKNPEDFNYTKKMRTLPGAGVVVQYDVNENLAIRSGLNYLQNGITLKATVDQDADMKVELENTLSYVQLPVNVLYVLPVAGFKLYGGVGGYINYGVSGKSKSVLTYTSETGDKITEKETYKAFKKEEEGGANLKKTDFGASALAGIQLPGGMFANVGYQLGLSNISRGEEGKYKNRGLQLSVGYFF